MSRPLVLGNGNILVCLDDHAQLRDFYFHYVGLENQMYKGCIGRIGVWIDGEFSWTTSQGWNTAIDYKHESMIGQSILVNREKEVEIVLSDLVYNEKNIFIRRVNVKNLSKHEREIRVFFNHQFHLYENKVGDTAYYDPQDQTIIHYKGRRVVLIGGQYEGKSFDSYTVGLFGLEGKEGTWKDAEDGSLSSNPVEHGAVDSTISFNPKVPANGNKIFDIWLAIGKSVEEVKDLNVYVLEKNPAYLAKTTEDYWYAWVNKKTFEFSQIDKRIIEHYKKSLLIMRTHVDNTGAIIASGDSDMLQNGRDTYAYVWGRDASIISQAFDKAGFFEVSRKFYEFANDVISEDGYFFHKYRSDKSLGSSWHPWISKGRVSLPIQEDETALVIISLWEHFQKTHDLEFIEKIYNSLIKKAANFMVGFRDEKTKLPFPTYDLWEMENGVSTFTASCVYRALVCASDFAQILGKDRDSGEYKRVSDELKESILKHLYNEKSGYFYKQINLDKDKNIIYDETIDISAFYGIFIFGVLDVNDPKLKRAKEVLMERIYCNTAHPGVARFEQDAYYRTALDTPGNPWIITTLWLAQYIIKSSQDEDSLQLATKWLHWAIDHAHPSGSMPEQINPHTGAAVSATPLIWSHAEFVLTVLLYEEKLNELRKR